MHLCHAILLLGCNLDMYNRHHDTCIDLLVSKIMLGKLKDGISTGKLYWLVHSFIASGKWRSVVLIAGGTEEAQTAYSEAYNAIFDLQLEYHSHMQPYLSAFDGTPRYAQIELWPMIVSPFCRMAVVCSVHAGSFLVLFSARLIRILTLECSSQSSVKNFVSLL